MPTRNFGIIFEREIDEELMLIRIGIAAQLQGVSASTLRRWEKDGKMLPYGRTRGGLGTPLLFLIFYLVVDKTNSS